MEKARTWQVFVREEGVNGVRSLYLGLGEKKAREIAKGATLTPKYTDVQLIGYSASAHRVVEETLFKR